MIRILKIGLLVFLLHIVTAVLCAVAPVLSSSVQFRKYSTRQGLSQSSVHKIEQDKFGYIWMGTTDGLNRFDGYGFTVFRSDPLNVNSLSNNDISALISDSLGNLWVGTRGGGLNYFDARINSFKRYSDINVENIIRVFCTNSKGVIFVGTSEGLYKIIRKADNTFYFKFLYENVKIFDYDGKQISPIRSRLTVSSFSVISDEEFLVGTDNGLFVYYHKENILKRILVDFGKYNVVTAIAKDKNDILWVSTYNGLSKIKRQKDGSYTELQITDNQSVKNNFLSGRFQAITIDMDDNVWAGSRGSGVLVLTPSGTISVLKNNPLDNNSINDDVINSFLIDKTGILWVGTESGGCNALDLYRKSFVYIPGNISGNEGFVSNSVTSITGNGKDQLWVGTATNGLEKVTLSDNSSFKVTHLGTSIYGVSPLINSEIFSLLYDSNKSLWIGNASNSIVKLTEGKGFKNYFAGGFVFSICEEKNKTIWFGTWGNSLGWVDLKSDKVNLYSNLTNRKPLSSDKVLSLFCDAEENLWIGTKTGGLNILKTSMIDKAFGLQTLYRHESTDSLSLSQNDVLCITRDKKGTVWIGTGNGLNRVIIPHGLTYSEALYTGKLQFKSFNTKQGLPNSVIHGMLEDEQGNLWLGTNNGLSMFNPDSETFKNYTDNEGSQVNEFHINSYYKDSQGYMYFGGVNGVVFFHPDSIHDNLFKPTILITSLKVLNTEVEPGLEINGKVILYQSITNTKEVVFDEKDKEITISFSAMHFANPQKVKYKFRLLGFNDKWQETIGNMHSATYTNLDHGNYVFQVLAANNDGLWADKPVELKIIVHPPFYKTIWAYISYALLVVLLLVLFKKYSLIAVNEKNRMLIERLEHRKQTELSEAKMKFFTNISHEIRTPLTLIADPLDQVFKNSKLDDYTGRQLNLISKNVQRLMDLVNQLLQFQKIDEGFVTIKTAPLHVHSFISEIANRFIQQAELYNFKINIKTEIPDLTIVADKELLTTVFYNLMANACKYAPDGSDISVVIKTKKRRYYRNFYQRITNLFYFKKNWAVIKVIDSGTGISQKEQKQVFNRFYQGNTQNASRHVGSGIGLSLVKEYVEMHNGFVEVSSKLNAGTAFSVYLPLEYKIMEVNDNEINNNKNKDDSDFLIKSDESVLKKKSNQYTVLVVEDDVQLAEYVSSCLVQNYNLLVAYDGKAGLEMAIENLPAIIITDVMMPEIDGLQLCKLVKSDVQTSHIPVVMLTAKATDENKIEGFELGVDAYITKPFNVKVLEAQIKALLDSRNQLKNAFKREIILQPSEVVATSTDEIFLKKLLEIIEQHMNDTEFDVPRLVDKMNMSHSVVFRKVKALTNLSLVEFIRSIRLKRAAQLLQNDGVSISEVGFMTGFNDPKYFRKCFIKEFGKSPSAYRTDIPQNGN